MYEFIRIYTQLDAKISAVFTERYSLFIRVYEQFKFDIRILSILFIVKEWAVIFLVVQKILHINLAHRTVYAMHKRKIHSEIGAICSNFCVNNVTEMSDLISERF